LVEFKPVHYELINLWVEDDVIKTTYITLLR